MADNDNAKIPELHMPGGKNRASRHLNRHRATYARMDQQAFAFLLARFRLADRRLCHDVNGFKAVQNWANNITRTGAVSITAYRHDEMADESDTNFPPKTIVPANTVVLAKGAEVPRKAEILASPGYIAMMEEFAAMKEATRVTKKRKADAAAAAALAAFEAVTSAEPTSIAGAIVGTVAALSANAPEDNADNAATAEPTARTVLRAQIGDVDNQAMFDAVGASFPILWLEYGRNPIKWVAREPIPKDTVIMQIWGELDPLANFRFDYETDAGPERINTGSYGMQSIRRLRRSPGYNTRIGVFAYPASEIGGKERRAVLLYASEDLPRGAEIVLPPMLEKVAFFRRTPEAEDDENDDADQVPPDPKRPRK